VGKKLLHITSIYTQVLQNLSKIKAFRKSTIKIHDQKFIKIKTMEKTFTQKEVEAMCTQSYMRGMMIQYEAGTNSKKPRKVFNQWLQELIQELPVGKFK